MKNEFKWFIILLGFTYYMYYLISTKKLYLFIHPKMTCYIIFAFIILAILCIFQIHNIFKNKHSISSKSVSSIFLIPLILAFLINPQGLSSDITQKKGLTTSPSFTTNANVKKGKGIIKLNDNNFSDTINEIENNINKYKNRKIEISGFVYKDTNFPKDCFVTARMLIICCAADAEVTGIACNKVNNNLKNNEWVKVTGIIKSMKNFDKEDTTQAVIPVIEVQNIKSIPKPNNPYIYLKKTLSK